MLEWLPYLRVLISAMQKAQLRRDIRPKIADLADPCYDWIFLTQYQLTDESQWEEVLSENTDGETQGKSMVRSGEAWISRPPDYRSEEVSRGL